MKVTSLPSIQLFVIVALQQWISNVSSSFVVDSIVSSTVLQQQQQDEINIIHPHIFDPTIHYDLYMEQINHFRNNTLYHQLQKEINDEDEKMMDNHNNVRRMQRCNKKINLARSGDKGWYTTRENTVGTHIFNSDFTYMKFNMVDTKCTELSKNQNAWAYLQFRIDCDMKIEDIIVNGKVNLNDDMTDYLNIFIDGKWEAQYSGNPINSATGCSFGNPKTRTVFQGDKVLKKGLHDFAIQVATNEGYIGHKDSYYSVEFDVKF